MCVHTLRAHQLLVPANKSVTLRRTAGNAELDHWMVAPAEPGHARLTSVRLTPSVQKSDDNAGTTTSHNVYVSPAQSRQESR